MGDPHAVGLTANPSPKRVPFGDTATIEEDAHAIAVDAVVAAEEKAPPHAAGVMESTEYGRGDEFGVASELRRSDVGNRRASAESLVRTLGVVVVLGFPP